LAYGVPTIVLKDSLLHSLFDGAIVEIDDARPETVRRVLARITEDSAFRDRLRENTNRNYETRSKMHLEEESKLKRVLSR